MQMPVDIGSRPLTLADRYLDQEQCRPLRLAQATSSACKSLFKQVSCGAERGLPAALPPNSTYGSFATQLHLQIA